MSTRLAWGILGTGSIAKTFAKGVLASKSGRLVGVGSRSQASADEFGALFALGKCYPTYDALINDPEVEAVYISMPHNLHAEWTIKAANAGKHILCEKPIGVNYAEAVAMIDAAKRNKVFLMEAFMYRCHPQTAKLVELIKAKVIGDVRLIQAAFSFGSNPPPEHRLVNHAMAGGGILDVGCYTTSMVRLIAGAAQDKRFADPTSIRAVGVIGDSRVDEYTVASMIFPGNVLAQVVTGIKLAHDNTLRVYGTEGSITVPSPWLPAREGGSTVMSVQRYKSREAEEVRVLSEYGIYTLEADCVARHLAEGQAPEMNWEDTLGNMRTLDLWRKEIGLHYDFEKPEALARKV
jgi:predicted dehydrogenase